jgi:hypothetical protein
MKILTTNSAVLQRLLLLLAMLPDTSVHAASWYDWVDKPWPARYVISVALDYTRVEEYARKNNDERRKKGKTSLWSFEEFFDASHPFKGLPHPSGWVYGDIYKDYDDFGYQVIAFDTAGKVLTSNRAPKPLQIRQTPNSDVRLDAMMVEGDATPGNPFYRLGEWYVRLPGAQGDDMTPAFCGGDDDGRYSVESSDRYFHPTMKFNVKDVINNRGTFGCREWAWQMKRPASVAGLGGQVPDAKGQCQGGFEPGMYKGKRVCPGLDESSSIKPNARGFVQPYMDVTTYHDKAGKKTHIGRFVGWMGFDDAPRPVIGKHGDYWLCLHECPDGEKPGVIADIADWTGKRGWPLPKPTPYFPDSKLMPGREDMAE